MDKWLVGCIFQYMWCDKQMEAGRCGGCAGQKHPQAGVDKCGIKKNNFGRLTEKGVKTGEIAVNCGKLCITFDNFVDNLQFFSTY